MIDQATIARFMAKVNTEAPSGCWEWTAATRGYPPHNYAHFAFEGKQITGHRLSYMIHKGEIPEGMKVCHSCDNPKCVKPDHLFLGTQQENMLDCRDKGRMNRVTGTRHHEAKLTPGTALEAVWRRGGGETKTAIAGRFGLSLPSISAVLSGETWSHATGIGRVNQCWT